MAKIIAVIGSPGSGKTTVTLKLAQEHFYSPSHAVDIVKRLLHHSGMIIDNSTPMSQGHLPNNTRITALKEAYL